MGTFNSIYWILCGDDNECKVRYLGLSFNSIYWIRIWSHGLWGRLGRPKDSFNSIYWIPWWEHLHLVELKSLDFQFHLLDSMYSGFKLSQPLWSSLSIPFIGFSTTNAITLNYMYSGFLSIPFIGFVDVKDIVERFEKGETFNSIYWIQSLLGPCGLFSGEYILSIPFIGFMWRRSSRSPRSRW